MNHSLPEDGHIVENCCYSLLAPQVPLTHPFPVRLALILSCLLRATLSVAGADDHVILCGAPALRQWEDLRKESEQHDRWWANFIRASTLRMAQIRIDHGPEANLVWIVYRPGYLNRANEDNKPYLRWIESQAEKRGCELIWVETGAQAIEAINSRSSGSIRTFDFFGHSNRFAFMLDYGSDIMAISKAWIHQKDLSKIKRSVFHREARCQSYGCHTGESMSRSWRAQLGNSLIGAIGKTDYSGIGQGIMPTVSGSWNR